MVTLEDLGDPDITELRDRLAALNDWNQRLDAVEDFARKRLLGAASGHAGVAWAYQTILKRGGNARIRDLAAKLEWSRKHLNDRFREMVGVGPKTVARMARFNRAMSMTKADEDRDWADIAAAAGYADQAHLTREFRQFAGTTPGRFAQVVEDVTFVQARAERSGIGPS
jgi:AraC-like DNA-binding protein